MLLLPHEPALEACKRSFCIFGTIENELYIKSVDFYKAATQLCIRIRNIDHTQEEAQAIDNILQKCRKYTVLLGIDAFMFPSIINDLSHQVIKEPWERLAIAANCCQYFRRLDTRVLRQKSASLSLSILTMCLINGEILDNSNSSAPLDPKMTVSTYLETQCLQSFTAPKLQHNLTYRKGCQFMHVELGALGIKTRGHIWELGKIIYTRRFSMHLPRLRSRHMRLSLYECQRLVQLVKVLRTLGHRSLAELISEFIFGGQKFETFAESYKLDMAKKIALAITDGKKLTLGRLWARGAASSPYTTIFI
ncbi:uncharacterized protein LY79DRAFT_585251 [Colletotrichum navitas]|uniref:Uncharacterized protein n=1 Tax=Colletotrichum navitas TaxID=681940 RepID=A0AAD8PJY4_9PEZI|nr:uncharacterized protein LY79DRAFT_585251 [Colletotrichum navitas]KAK1564211.1 hypothetical protein LY79DRAFT_585251 [Colletotrichum navitas]